MSAYYHIWHHSKKFEGKPPYAAVSFRVPSISGGYQTKKFHSLRYDMEHLRQIGAAEGIVDPSVVEVGRSTDNKELWALKVGKGSSHKVLFTGCHHAREWISVEVPFLVAKFLIETYLSTPQSAEEKVIKKRVVHLLENREIWFVPMVNPDGHNYSRLRNRMWRPNRKKYKYAKRFEIIAPQLSGDPDKVIKVKAGTYTGVDLNRNYPSANWGKETSNTSRNPKEGGLHGIWAGPSAGSEIETKAMVDLIANQGFLSSITYHSYSQLLMYPGAAAKDAFLQFVGEGMASLINSNGNPYVYQSGDDLYPTTGDMLEYCYEATPGRPVFTPELRPLDSAPDNLGFSGLPESEIIPTFKENLGAALALINCAGFDAPAQDLRLKCRPDTNVVQVVRNCWKAFEDFKV